ncbi:MULTISPECIES: TetR family transcriptional regulator [Bacillaceae]|uniref:TetR family transcriptional regulator n=2 Tax=Bacillaceae TaxID=186817 RepID=A0ABR8VJH0_9BACI|nr:MULTISPECIES: TetR family transcriptional regulator [Bacillaceae]MBD8004915.1 TetR family transcriptional regulator [Bacillus norwichensis]GGP08760.1 TetR family transcriptional regulator [Oceanobacillus neutriphilus]
MAPKVSEEYKKERKRELIEVAKKVFIEKGFVHTSMQDIMDKAGISRGAFYSYFDNIDHVFIEVLKYDDQKDIQYFVSSDEGPIWPQLKKWVEEQQFYIEAIEQTLLYAKAEFFLSSNYANNKDNFPYISERYKRTTEAIEEVLNEGMLKGEFRPQQSTRSIARYLLSFINGLMLDTFQLGHEQTKVKNQLSVLLFSLEKLINPKSAL